MKKLIKISFITILVMSFIFSGCSSSVSNTQKDTRKKTRTTNKTPVNNPVVENDEEFQKDSALLPLTLEAIEAGTIFIFEKENRKLFIQKNNGIIEDAYSSIAIEPGDKICFYGYDYEANYYNHDLNIQCTGNCYVYGNVMSLLEFTTFAGKKEIKKEQAFSQLFINNTKIKNHETLDIVLPATSLAWSCYNSMFYGCTGLTQAPELPVTSLAKNCYLEMFSHCTGLIKAPELPATSLSEGCYNSMFYGCTGLTKAPELPATSLARCTKCYYEMFKECSNLNSVVCLATNISGSECTKDWLNNVSATGTFVKAAGMNNWTSGVDGIPEGWTTQDYVAP